MLNPLKILTKFIKSSNEKELDRIQKIVAKVNNFENDISKLSESEFKLKTEKLVEIVKNGTSLDNILPEAFALVREASRRVNKERHFDVQIIGGVVLHEKKNS